ncbi:MAG: Gfo/Idh/MocA family protein [Fimbriimonadaceae bacterium]
MSDDQVRIGIIGCGQIAQHHMRTYSQMSNVRMVACADVNPAATAKAQADFGIEHAYADFRELLKRDDLDAVDVCLHNNLHRPVTVEALQSGKHVYCEKPIAGSYADGKAMVDTAKSTGKHLHIQLSTLYSNETQAAKELIDLGELGHIYHARSTGHRRKGRPYVDGYGTPNFVQKRHASGGALYDMGVYHIARILYLIGNPAVEKVSGKTYDEVPMHEGRRTGGQWDVEELGLGFVRMAGGLTLDIIESWAINLDKFDGSVVVGSHGGVRLNPFGFFKSYGYIDISAEADLWGAKYRWDNVRGDGAYYGDSQHHWIAALQGKVELLPTAEIALNTMLISEAIYRSNELDREVTAAEVAEASVSTAIEV